MRLTTVQVDRLPGLTGPLSVTGLQPGMNVIVGPNASGKSSLIRALTAVLYPGRSGDQVAVRLDLEDSRGGPVTVRRTGAVVEWQAAGELVQRPALPPAELLGAYLLRLEDLIALEARSSGEVDDHISEALELELTGGVNLRALRALIPKQKTAGRKESSALKHAQSELNALRRRHAGLVQRQSRLSEIRQTLAEARLVAERGARVSAARELAVALADLRIQQSELEAMPAQLAHLTGDETEEVARLRRSMEACRAEEERLHRDLADAEERSEAVGLPEDLSVSEARRLVLRAEDLCRQEQLLEQKEIAAQAARAATQAAWTRMGGVAEAPAEAPDPQVVDRVERLVQRQVEVRARLQRIRTRLDDLGDDGEGARPAAAETDSLDALRRCRSDLARWLESAPSAGRVPGWAWGVAFVLAAAGAGVALLRPGAEPAGLLAAPWLPLATSVTLLVWLAVCWLLLRRTTNPAVRVAKENLGRSATAAGLLMPHPLTHSEAARQLEELVAEIARLEAEMSAARDREREAGALRKALEAATRDAGGLQAALSELRSRHGFEVGGAQLADGDGRRADDEPDGGFAYWLSAALEHARAVTRQVEAEEEVRDLEDRVGDARSEVLGFLSRCAWGATNHADATGTDLLSACKEVATAVEERDRARERAGELRRALQRTEGDVSAAERALDNLARRLSGASDDAETRMQDSPTRTQDERTRDWSAFRLDELALTARDLADALPAWREARAECQKLEVAADIHARTLAVDPKLLAAAQTGDADTIEKVAAEARIAEDMAEKLDAEIKEVEADVRLAEADRALEEATARARQALDALEEHLDEALEASAARTLLDTVEEEHESAVKPAALERARSWFRRFTHGDFELTFTQDGAGGWRFGAVDRRAGAGGLRLNPSELSTGTRAQLLVAARLAFALEAEKSYGSETGPVEPLPFFLDEALTTSDHERFFQVANAIFDVAEETDRQFIYLSARNEDAELWRDVAAERGASVTSVAVQGAPARSPLA